MTRIIHLSHDPTQPRPAPSKLRNQPTTVDGIRFASKAEAARYGELLLLQQGGAITGLVTHPKFTLAVNEQRIGAYIADFAYRTADDLLVVEDVKSPLSRTPVYQLKRRLLRALWGIEIVEVDA